MTNEFSYTDESSDTDFGEHEDEVLLLDTGNNSDGDDTAYVSDNNFMWRDVENYAWRETLVDLKTVLQVWLML